MNSLIISGPNIYTEEGILQNVDLHIHEGKIASIQTRDVAHHKDRLVFPKNYHLIPGFIDLHVHGMLNYDVMDGTPDALKKICKTLAKDGTTAFLATTMTAGIPEIDNALKAIHDFMMNQKKIEGAHLLGVHLEGPFISPKKAGAQRMDYILPPNLQYMDRWYDLSGHTIKLVTLAPELPNSFDLIHYLKQKNIVAAIGHSDASYDETVSAIQAGCRYATHLFNAMRGIQQREPGVVTGALLSKQVFTEVIVDGIHLHPAIVELIWRLKGRENIILVTDAMRATCLHDGHYELGGQTVSVKEGIARLANGTLAGSLLRMQTAVKNMLQFTPCSLSDVIQMASFNPAKIVGIDKKKGSIALGKDADLVILDENFEVQVTICEGVITYKKIPS